LVFRLTGSAGFVVGVEVERRHVRVLLGDAGYRVLGPGLDSRVTEDDPRRTFDEVKSLVGKLLRREGIAHTEVTAVGVGLPASVGADGRITASGLLDSKWSELDAAEQLSDRLKITTVIVDNDANLGALGVHMFPAAIDAGLDGPPVVNNLIYVQLNEGIGAGLILGGELFRGSHGQAGEIGHTTLDTNASAPLCGRCGARGCLELYTGGPAITKQARSAGYAVDDLSDVISLAASGHAGSLRIISDAGDKLGTALGSLFNVIDPDRIVLGGELAQVGEPLRAAVQEHLHRNGLKPTVRQVTVEMSCHGVWTVAHGALAAALRFDGRPYSTGPADREADRLRHAIRGRSQTLGSG
jgi:predicted NBD/HSP70 family sugar kinase